MLNFFAIFYCIQPRQHDGPEDSMAQQASSQEVDASLLSVDIPNVDDSVGALPSFEGENSFSSFMGWVDKIIHYYTNLPQNLYPQWSSLF